MVSPIYDRNWEFRSLKDSQPAHYTSQTGVVRQASFPVMNRPNLHKTCKPHSAWTSISWL